MNLIFAKWLLAGAIQLAAGPNQPWPLMTPLELPATEITQFFTQAQPGQVCLLPLPGQPPVCLPPPQADPATQHFCVTGGVYRVDFRLRVRSAGRADSVGHVRLVGPAQAATQLVDFYVVAGGADFVTTSLAIAAEEFSCYQLRYDATAPVRIDPDPAKTSLTISR